MDQHIELVKSIAKAAGRPVDDVAANNIVCEYLGRDLAQYIQNPENLRLQFEDFFNEALIE